MSESHVPGHTTPTETRESQDYTQPVRIHRLEEEARALLEEARANQSGRSAKTLAKDNGLNVVMTAVQSGTTLEGHSVHNSALLHCVVGRVRVEFADDKGVELGAGDAVTLAAGLDHRLVAVEDFAALLVVGAK